jgi:putative ABC transport system permease protein
MKPEMRSGSFSAFVLIVPILTGLIILKPATVGLLAADELVAAIEKVGGRVTTRSQLVLLQIAQSGANRIIIRTVRPPQVPPVDGAIGRQERYGLTRIDFRRITTSVPSISSAIPMREFQMEVKFKEKVVKVRVVGSTAESVVIGQLRLNRGRFYTDADNRRNVVVLSNSVSQKLFPNENPIGKTIDIGGSFFRIVGETKQRQHAESMARLSQGQSAGDSSVYIPLTTMWNHFGDSVPTRKAESYELSEVTLIIKSVSKIGPTANVVENLLKKSHKTLDYTIVIPKELIEQIPLLGSEARNDIVMVDLRATGIADTGLAMVGSFPKLEVLLLNDTAITDSQLEHLHDLRRLKILWLQNTKVTDVAVIRLRKALPQCQIYR